MRQRKQQTHENLITFCLKEDILKEYAAFLRLTTFYTNSVIYNFTYRKVAKLLKISESTAKRYIKVLRQYRFLEVQKKATNKNLKLHSFKKILFYNCDIYRAKHKCTIIIKPKYTIMEIEAILVNKLIQQQGRSAMYQHKKHTSPECSIPSPKFRTKTEDSSTKSHVNGRMFVSFNRCKKLISEYDDHFLTGLRKLSKNIGISVSKLWSRVQILKRLGLLASMPLNICIREMPLEMYTRNKKAIDFTYQGYAYYHNGCVYVSLGSIYNFSDYPVSSDTIDFNTLKKF